MIQLTSTEAESINKKKRRIREEKNYEYYQPDTRSWDGASIHICFAQFTEGVLSQLYSDVIAFIF